MDERLYLSFGAEFFPGDWDSFGFQPPYTNAFVWMQTPKSELIRKTISSVSGSFTDRGENTSRFDFLSIMALSVYLDVAKRPRKPVRGLVHGIYAPSGWHE